MSRIRRPKATQLNPLFALPTASATHLEQASPCRVTAATMSILLSSPPVLLPSPEAYLLYQAARTPADLSFRLSQSKINIL
jgi:hypothetical protein